MELLLTIKDKSKVAHIMSLLEKYSYVKVKPVLSEKEQLIADLKEAVKEMKLIKAGKKKARNAEDFLNEL
jgi:hypothetical protein